MKKFEVELVRIHKSSPYNCSGYIPEIECDDEDQVINLPEVQSMIANTYGKNFIVNIFQLGVAITGHLQYKIEKLRAI